jgi:hypothetical protein
MQLPKHTLKCLAVAAAGAASLPLLSLSGPAIHKEPVAVRAPVLVGGQSIVQELQLLGVKQVQIEKTTLTLKKTSWKTLSQKQRNILRSRLHVERVKCNPALGDGCPGCGLG